VAIRAPDGSELKLAAGETNFSQTMTPGIYTMASTQPPKRFAVNLDAAESRTAPLPADELERYGAPIARAATAGPAIANEAASKIRLQNAELENRQKLWRWFLVATLAVLLFETWLAGRTARRLSVPEGATT
jgi:anti-sigma-K factor RskA